MAVDRPATGRKKPTAVLTLAPRPATDHTLAERPDTPIRPGDPNQRSPMLQLLKWLGVSSRKRRPAPRPRRVSLEVEELEGRRLLSTLSVVQDATGNPNVFA